MRRWRENDWDESEERDSQEFLDLEKDIYLKLYPRNGGIFQGDEKEKENETKEEEADDNDVECLGTTKSKKSVAKKSVAKKSGAKKSSKKGALKKADDGPLV